MVLAALLTWLRYRHIVLTEFNGLSGDLAGWFLEMAELWMLGALVISELIMG